MPITLGLNILSLNTIRQLDLSSQRLQKNFEKLSSGQRINRSSDDAAVLAFSENLRANITIKNRAVTNISDGFSALEIASDSINSISNLLTRMAELAEQGANGVIANSQRVALNKEFQELDKEIRRIAKTTNFNGLNLLGGTQNSAAAQLLNSDSVNTSIAASSDGRYVTYYNTTTGSFQQLDTVDNTRITIATGVTGEIESSASGEIIAFNSTSNLTGENASGVNQIYIFNRLSRSISQVTSSVAGDFNFALSEDGSSLVFQSATQYDSQGNSQGAAAGGTFYHANLNSGVFSGIGSYVFNGGTRLSISSDGTKIAIGARNDPLGTNVDGNNEIFYWDPATTNSFRQLTFTSGSHFVSGELEIANDGTIYAISTQNPTGGNPSARNQLFKLNPTTLGIEQLTNNTSASALDTLTLSADGSIISFRSAANLVSQNSSLVNQIYTFDLTDNTLTQKTTYTNSTLTTAGIISGDGNSYFYASSGLRGVYVGAKNSSLSIQAGSVDNGNGEIISLIGGINGTLRGLGGIQLTSQSASRGALDTTLRNIELLGALNGTVGAGLSRLLAAGNVLRAQREEFGAARSRILDADVALVTSEILRDSILQQTGAALLAQANLQPQIALKLLGI